MSSSDRRVLVWDVIGDVGHSLCDINSDFGDVSPMWV